jgi:DNA-binding beta-propeller fold protein YncE
VLAAAFAATFWLSPTRGAKADRGSKRPPRFTVEASWPKPLPSTDGHQWVTGEVGGSCMDSNDHVITVNRGFQTGGLSGQDGTSSIGSPPVVEYDAEGNVANAWGDQSKTTKDREQGSLPAGSNKVMPNGIHGCHVDYQDNVWIAGNGDGVVQKWTHDGKTMLLQMGEKGKCDTPPAPDPRAGTFACGNFADAKNGYYEGKSKTLLNQPADLGVDPNPDPQTGERGSVYIADGYGNHRIAVFDARGKFLRQWGSVGSGDGQFGLVDGGHPHCVVLGKDRLVYTCDRSQNRIEVFDRMGNFQRSIAVDIPASMMPLGNLGTQRACDITLSPDRQQSWIYDTDLGNDSVWVLDRAQGAVAARIGRAGHNAGEFAFAHTVDIDSTGQILYVAETITGRRIQKFVREDSDDDD